MSCQQGDFDQKFSKYLTFGWKNVVDWSRDYEHTNPFTSAETIILYHFCTRRLGWNTSDFAFILDRLLHNDRHTWNPRKMLEKWSSSPWNEKKLDFSKNQLPKNFGRLFLVCPDIFRWKEKSFRLGLHRTTVSELFGSIRPKSLLRHHPATQMLRPFAKLWVSVVKNTH